MPESQLSFENVEVGDDIGPVDRVVTDEQVREFVSIWQQSRGPNRFTDEAVAKKEGLSGPIVPGAMNIAIMSQLLTGWSPAVVLRKLDVVFRQVVPHNAPLQLRGIVTDKRMVDGEPQLECDVMLENDQGDRLIIGKATVALPAGDS